MREEEERRLEMLVDGDTHGHAAKRRNLVFTWPYMPASDSNNSDNNTTKNNSDNNSDNDSDKKNRDGEDKESSDGDGACDPNACKV